MSITKVTRNMLNTGIVDNSNATAITIDSSENVGIGTASPASLLHLEGADGVAQIRLQRASTTIGGIIKQTSYGLSYDAFDGNTGAPSHQFRTSADGTNFTERMRLDASGKLGIGVDTPSAWYSNNLVVSAPSEGGITIASTNTANGNYLCFADGTSGNEAYRGIVGYVHSTDSMFFQAGGAERMRIDSSGKLLLGTTSALYSGTSTFGISFNGTTDNAIVLQTTRSATGSNFAVFTNSSGTLAGYISHTGSTAVTYNTSSDYRLKENAEPIQNGLERLNQLKPVKFDWKDTGVSSEGFIAHEAQEVFPDAVSGEKDGEDMQGMDYGRITPLLVKAIQELSAEVEELKSKLNES